MTPIQYLNLLNYEIKEKLIGMCFDRKILDAFENTTLLEEQETLEDKITDEEEDEESKGRFGIIYIIFK